MYRCIPSINVILYCCIPSINVISHCCMKFINVKSYHCISANLYIERYPLVIMVIVDDAVVLHQCYLLFGFHVYAENLFWFFWEVNVFTSLLVNWHGNKSLGNWNGLWYPQSQWYCLVQCKVSLITILSWFNLSTPLLAQQFPHPNCDL